MRGSAAFRSAGVARYTGCGFDLVSRSEVESIKDHITHSGKTTIFDTADGEVPARNVIPLFLPHMH